MRSRLIASNSMRLALMRVPRYFSAENEPCCNVPHHRVSIVHEHSALDTHGLMNRFLENALVYLEKYNPALQDLAKSGQKPKWTVVSCVDSRYTGVGLWGKPGERINIANIANIVPPYDDSGVGVHGVSAALQFSVESLKVQGIMILGHAGCGGIRALMENKEAKTDGSDFVTPWVNIVAPAREKVVREHGHLSKEEQASLCEKEAIKISYLNLLTFPFIQQAVQKGNLSIYAAHFDPEQGLSVLNPEAGTFKLALKVQSQDKGR